MGNSHKWKDTSAGAKEWQERTRAKIQASKVIDDGIKIANDEIKDASTARVSMIKALMDRVLPAQTQATVEQTTIEAPQDLEGLVSSIQQSKDLQMILINAMAPLITSNPELQAFLSGLLQKNNKEPAKETVEITEEMKNTVSTRLQ